MIKNYISSFLITIFNMNSKEKINLSSSIKRQKIPKALREQVWIKYFGKVYEHKCYIKWCKNKINVFNYHVGHNIPLSKRGTTTIDNLYPICDRCNLSMNDKYTIEEWNKLNGYSKFSCMIL